MNEGRLSLVTAPALEPVSTVVAKGHLRVDITDDDSYIAGLVAAVRTNLEKQFDTAFVTQTWELYLDNWPGGDEIPIPLWPLQSVTTVKYTDEDGNESTYSSDDYLVDAVSRPGRLKLKSSASWPSVTLQELNAVVVRFVAGYGDAASDVPEPIRQAILVQVGELYENREDLLIAQGVTVMGLKIEERLMANYRGFNT